MFSFFNVNGNSFLLIKNKETITLMTCANTVAIAAPAVPIFKIAHKTKSPKILKTQAITTVINGVLESPKPLKIHPIKL